MSHVRKPQDHTVVVLGASPKPVRYSYQAVQMLHSHGYRVLPVHPKVLRIDHIPTLRSLTEINEPVHTLTLYVGPDRVKAMVKEIVALRPGRLIMNPGAESRDLGRALDAARIPYEHACTLVLLRTQQF